MGRRKKKNPRVKQIGRVDFRAILENRSSVFQDRRTRRARSRSDARRRAIDDASSS